MSQRVNCTQGTSLARTIGSYEANNLIVNERHLLPIKLYLRNTKHWHRLRTALLYRWKNYRGRSHPRQPLAHHPQPLHPDVGEGEAELALRLAVAAFGQRRREH